MSLPLHQWDIVRVRIQPRDRDPHPAVVVSCEEDCQDERILRVNVLYGGKRQPRENVLPYQLMLNSADGLEFQTLFDCSTFYLVDKARIESVIGRVSAERRKALARKVVEALRFPIF